MIENKIIQPPPPSTPASNRFANTIPTETRDEYECQLIIIIIIIINLYYLFVLNI